MSAALPEYDFNPDTLRRVFSHFPTGVVALVATGDNGPVGLIASSFTVGVSMDPPLVLCAIQRSSATWPELRQHPRIGVSVLAEDQGNLIRQIAGKQRHERFTGITLSETGSSARFIPDAPVWFECSLEREIPAGDHDVVLLQVHRLGADPTPQPLIWHGSTFRRLIPS